ncbi:hypothetical protein CAC42_773 [Sphaceloma murrayae]|uniref:UFSP1/2/DUB catalytic domain-containing protein n=1 Tax=Sphaceloma murrayae TaxID=2082308 RepID=A0A2K1QK24_9PEZI|nr:hypothetical protein CAC42_773 [Sphaceloma murrayae]
MRVDNIIPVLDRLLAKSEDTAQAVLCHSELRQFTNFRHDGGFCMYRGLQMIISYLRVTRHPDACLFRDEDPSIIQLQEFIEDAFARLVRWGAAHHPRTMASIPLENGYERYRFKGTRKNFKLFHAWLLLQSRGVKCQVRTFQTDIEDDPWLHPSQASKGNAVTAEWSTAARKLFAYVEQHFSTSSARSSSECVLVRKVRRTNRAPIMLVRPHHTLIIVGHSLKNDGKRSLIVFDPSVGIPGFIRKHAASPETPIKPSEPELMAATYLCNEKVLEKYDMLCTLTPLDGPIEKGTWDMITTWRETDGTIVHATATDISDGSDLAAEPADLPLDPTLTRSNSVSTVATMATAATGDSEVDREIA